MLHGLGLAFAALAAPLPQDKPGNWMVWGFYGQSWFILGSEDFRRGGGLAIQWIRPEPRFTFRRNRGSLVLEANYTRTEGGDKFEFDADRTHAVGLAALARYEFRSERGPHLYVEGGWGVQWADRITIDLPSQFNSTPILGAGFIIPSGRTEVYIGGRWIHVSNAGTKGNNPGQNQLFFMVGVRF